MSLMLKKCFSCSISKNTDRWKNNCSTLQHRICHIANMSKLNHATFILFSTLHQSIIGELVLYRFE